MAHQNQQFVKNGRLSLSKFSEIDEDKSKLCKNSQLIIEVSEKFKVKMAGKSIKWEKTPQFFGVDADDLWKILSVQNVWKIWSLWKILSVSNLAWATRIPYTALFLLPIPIFS